MAETIFGNPEEKMPVEDKKQETPEESKASEHQDVEKNTDESTSSSDPYADLLTEIRAEDGRQKYATVEDAIKSIPHAQNRIRELSQEMEDLRKRAEEADNIDTIMERVRSMQATEEKPSKGTELDETKLAELVESTLTKREQELRMKANADAVANQLKEKFGDRAEEAYTAKAEELGLDVDTLNSLSSRSPKAVLEYFGISKTSSSSADGFKKSSVNSEAFYKKPQQAADPLSRFRSSDSDLISKWRSAASKIEG